MELKLLYSEKVEITSLTFFSQFECVRGRRWLGNQGGWINICITNESMIMSSETHRKSFTQIITHCVRAYTFSTYRAATSCRLSNCFFSLHTTILPILKTFINYTFMTVNVLSLSLSSLNVCSSLTEALDSFREKYDFKSSTIVDWIALWVKNSFFHHFFVERLSS